MGMFNPRWGQSECTMAAAGHCVNHTGATAYFICGPGTYSNASGATRCQDCPPGYASSHPGATYCNPCPSGTYSNGTSGATGCNACPSLAMLRGIFVPAYRSCGPDAGSIAIIVIVCLAVIGLGILAFILARRYRRRRQAATIAPAAAYSESHELEKSSDSLVSESPDSAPTEVSTTGQQLRDTDAWRFTRASDGTRFAIHRVSGRVVCLDD